MMVRKLGRVVLVAVWGLLLFGARDVRAEIYSEIDKLEGQIAFAESFLDGCSAELDALKPPGPGASEEEWTAYNTKLSDLERCLSTLKNRLDTLREALAKLVSQLPIMSDPKHEESPAVKRAREQVAEYKQRLADAERRRAALKAQFDAVPRRGR